MHENDRQKFADELSALSMMYRQPLNLQLFEMYWRALAEFSIDEVVTAITKHVKNPDGGQFMPRPADLIQHIGCSTKRRAKIAWSKVFYAIGRVGGYQSVRFDDPLIHRVVSDMAGWVWLCSQTVDTLEKMATEFEEKYTELLESGVGAIEYPPHLPGRDKITEPVYIGSEKIGNHELIRLGEGNV